MFKCGDYNKNGKWLKWNGFRESESRISPGKSN